MLKAVRVPSARRRAVAPQSLGRRGGVQIDGDAERFEHVG
jgi:hypothetical protein